MERADIENLKTTAWQQVVQGAHPTCWEDDTVRTRQHVTHVRTSHL